MTAEPVPPDGLLCPLELAWGSMAKAIETELAPAGITFRQFLALAWIVHDGPAATPSRLAARLDIRPPTVTGFVHRLERLGWTASDGADGDRRTRILRLTPAGEAVWATVVEALLRARARATARLTPEQVASLISMLRTVHETLGRDPEPKPSGE